MGSRVQGANMTLSNAIQVARQVLYDDTISTRTKHKAYIVLAEWHQICQARKSQIL